VREARLGVIAARRESGAYRTTPSSRLFAREKGGFYHDGRFKDYGAVIDHFKPVLGFELTRSKQSDFIQFLKSLCRRPPASEARRAAPAARTPLPAPANGVQRSVALPINVHITKPNFPAEPASTTR
jgi:hypothetical protein